MDQKLRSLSSHFAKLNVNVKFYPQTSFDENFQLVQNKKKDNKNLACKSGCISCSKNCCQMFWIRHRPFRGEWPKRYDNRRAGVLVLDTSRKYVLLVQSCGRLWGAAKGCMEPGETPEMAALRELKEETGIEAKSENLSIKIKINQDSYYILLHPKRNLKIPQSKEYNDVSGLGWVSLECLRENCGYFKNMLNLHAKILIYKGLNICGFTKINMKYVEI